MSWWFNDAATVTANGGSADPSQGRGLWTPPPRATQESLGLPVTPDGWSGNRPVYYFPSSAKKAGYTNMEDVPGWSFVAGDPSNALVTTTTPTGTTTTTVGQSTGQSAPATQTGPTTQVVSLADRVAAATQALNAEVSRELKALLSSLDATSRLYESAFAAVSAALDPAVAQELARLRAITDPSTVQAEELASAARVDQTAADAYRRWASSTNGAPQVQQTVQQAVNAGPLVTGESSGPVSSLAPDAVSSSLSLLSLPGVSDVGGWFDSIKARFTAAPNELRDDLAHLDTLLGMAGPNNPAVADAGGLKVRFQDLLSRWADAAVTYSQLDDASQAGGVPDSATVVKMISFAGVVVAFFATKAAAEAALDADGRAALDPDQYAAWAVSHPSSGVTDWTPWVLLLGVGVGLLWISRPRRPK